MFSFSNFWKIDLSVYIISTSEIVQKTTYSLPWKLKNFPITYLKNF